MGKEKSLQARIIAYYSKTAKSKTTLFTNQDLRKKFAIESKGAANSLYNMHRAELICRHKEKKDRKYQYAIEIPEEFNDPYEQSFQRTAAPVACGSSGRRNIMKMFAAIQNNMSHLEDMIIKELEGAEIITKQKGKLNSLMRAMKKIEDGD